MDRHDDLHASADGDVTTQFWGTLPGWRDSGEVPSVRRRTNDATGSIARTRARRTGPIQRTRTHHTGAVPQVEAAAPAPRDTFADDLWFDTSHVDGRPVAAHQARLAERHATEPDDRYDDRLDDRHDDRYDDGYVEIELTPHGAVAMHGGWFARLVGRLGLGDVDPLLVRLGAIVVIGVLLVPFAMALRADASGDQGGSDGSLVVDAGAGAEAGAPAPQPLADPSTTATPSQPAGDASTSATAAAETTTATTVPVETTAAATAGDTTTLDDAAADDGTTEAQAVTGSGVELAGPADADETAERVEPVCAATYTVHVGDYWLRLADEAGIALSALLAANGATTETALYQGDQVCLPPGAAMPSPPPPPTTAAPPTTQAPVTTAPRTTVPATTTPPPPAPTSAEQAKAIIREVWPDHLEDRAIEIAYRESRWVSTAYNGWCCYGLFQIYWNVHKSWLDDMGVTSSSQLFDARTNARVALEIYNRAGGWGPWSTA